MSAKVASSSSILCIPALRPRLRYGRGGVLIPTPPPGHQVSDLGRLYPVTRGRPPSACSSPSVPTSGGVLALGALTPDSSPGSSIYPSPNQPPPTLQPRSPAPQLPPGSLCGQVYRRWDRYTPTKSRPRAVTARPPSSLPRVMGTELPFHQREIFLRRSSGASGSFGLAHCQPGPLSPLPSSQAIVLGFFDVTPTQMATPGN